MDPNNLDRDFKLISKFNGVCLNIEEKTRLEIGLQELMISEKNESLKFWGKIPGDDSDYYIALATNYKNHYEFPEKKFYFSTPNFVFELLPETFEYHDKDFLDSYYKPLKGNPNLVIKQYGGAAPAEGENPENNNENPPPENPENPEENKPATTNIQDPDASVDDNAPIPEPPKENFTEKLKLSYLVRQIDYDTNIFPEGALCLTTDHEIRVNKSFKGLCKENIGNMEKFLHFRRVSQEKRELINQPDAVFRYDIFDDITKDTVKGSWTIELDPTKTICNLRSLLWPGYFAVHQSGTKNYCGVYLGNGFKNAELPFMI
jgi:radial spoke head protein 9